MKIVFLCGSLEPYRDGVGDYTRRLAGELIRQSHSVGIVSLNDRDIKKITIEHQKDVSVKIPVIRIPKAFSSQKRYSFAKEWINSFDPQWLSLQYVPFAFQNKGLPFSLGRQLKTISQDRHWHVMFHELWVGTDVGASLKMICWGKLQRQIINSMLKKLKPKVVHTQTNVYLAQLKKLGYRVEYLPLFSSFPVTGIKSPADSSSSKNDKKLPFVVFGSIHPGAPFEQFAKELLEYEKKYKVSVKITFVGRNGAELQNWLSILQKLGINNEVLGEQPPERISRTFSDAQFGISTTPVLLAEKSSAIATMLEHELPVICLRQLQIKGCENEKTHTTVLHYKTGNIEQLLLQDIRFYKRSDVRIIAKKLSSSLSNA